MHHMKFSRLSLLSQNEARGLQIDFSSPQTVLVAGNGSGKSAILKSLYETLGARPHKVDKSWVDARVISLLDFSIDKINFYALKFDGSYTIFDHNKNVLINTSRVTAELGPFLARILNFQLVLNNKKEETKIPPPSYAFAPFYVDQDRSWQKPWDSFSDLSMFANSARSLSEYHSGLKPNQYYEAKADRDRISVELAAIDAERRAVDQALRKVREQMPAIPLALDIDAFSQETDRLVAEGQTLHNRQSKYRADLAALNEEHQLWSDQVAVVESALKEADETFVESLKQPPEVECPMCGQHYANRIADQFGLRADADDLMAALQTGRSRLRDVSDRITEQRRKIDLVAVAIESVQQVLAVRREDISLRDVVIAEGRHQAQKFLQERLAALDHDYAAKRRQMDDAIKQMKVADSRNRKQAIQLYFSQRLTEFCQSLDVRLPDRIDLHGLHIGRGSEGPRGLAAYYYAFLHTTQRHGSATFCPIVIDAPNQQGQDQGHLKAIMEFLLSRMPADSQVIIAAETGATSADAVPIDVSWKKRQVLREDAYESTREYVRTFLQRLVP